jgi:hypothetical protein
LIAISCFPFPASVIFSKVESPPPYSKGFSSRRRTETRLTVSVEKAFHVVGGFGGGYATLPFFFFSLGEGQPKKPGPEQVF